MNSLEYHEVSFSYPESQQVLKNISFRLLEGEILGIIGSNGAGKSTLLKLANRLLEPQEGKITLTNKPIGTQVTSQIAHQLVLTFQFSRTQFFAPSVEKELLTVIRLHHDSKEEQNIHLTYLLENFGLIHQRKSPPYQLSGGEQRKLILALAFASSASFFLFDEPTANLDQISRKFFLSRMIALKEDNKGIIIASHDMEFVFAVADRIMILDEGQLAFLGSTDKFLKQFQSLQKPFFHIPEMYSFLKTVKQRDDITKELMTILPDKAFFTPLTTFKKILEAKNSEN